MAAILAEHAGEDMDGRQDTLVAAVGEGRAMAAVVAEIAVDHLPFEDVADHVAAVAAAALHHDVAQAEVIEILPAGHVAGQQDAVPVAARSLDVQSLQQEKAEGRSADHLDDVGAVTDLRYQARAGPDDAALPRHMGARLDPQA